MSNKFITFIVEGNAEEFIIKKLIKHNRLIDELSPKTKYDYEILNMDGKDNLVYEKWENKTNLSKDRYSDITFVIVGDQLYKRKHDFDNCDDSKDELSFFLGDNYIENIKYYSINPEPEYLIIEKNGLAYKFNKTRENPIIFVSRELSIKKKTLKSYEYWESEFKDINEIISLLRKLIKIKKPKNNKTINFVDIIK